MSTYFNDIQAALDSRLDEIIGSPDISWEHHSSSPGGDYLRPTFLPGETIQRGLGDFGKDHTIGIYQVDIFKRVGTGRSAQSDIIADLFKRDSVLTYNSVYVRIVSVSIERTATEDAYSITPISIRWETYTPQRP